MLHSREGHRKLKQLPGMLSVQECDTQEGLPVASLGLSSSLRKLGKEDAFLGVALQMGPESGGGW